MDRKKYLVPVLGLGALSLVGCGGISPGDYVIYRVSQAGDTDQSSGCFYPDTAPTPGVASDSNTIRGSSTWIIYAAIDDKLYLDSGTFTLEGAVTDTGYSFSGKTVDVSFDNDTDGTGAKRTDSVTTTITVTTDGDAISGTGVKKTSHACSGSTCGDKIPSCSETTSFVGTKVEDVELKHDI